MSTELPQTMVTYIYDVVNETDTLNDTANSSLLLDPDLEAPYYSMPHHAVEDYLIRLVLYGIIFVVSTIGNAAVLCSLIHSRRRRKSRVNLLILHLTVADLMITFFNIPIDFIWILTIRWHAGDIMCRICMYIAMLGLYASPFILIVISLDRFASIVFPLSVRQADMRCKIMLRVAWIACFVASAPQVFVHEVMAPDFDPDFRQCVDYGFKYGYPVLWNIYHWFVVCTTYFIPLAIIVCCYTAIVIKIFGSSSIRSYSGTNGNTMTLRRSGADALPKARVRALIMTGTIVTAFIFCWTPSCIHGTIAHVNPELGGSTSKWLNQTLLSLLYSNAAVDPIVYGMFTVDFRRFFPGCFKCSGRKVPWRAGRKISRRSTTTSSNNYPQVTYASSTRLGGTTASYHVIESDNRLTAEKYV